MPSDDLELRDSPVLRRIRARTPARLFVGRSGAGYRTRTQLDLRAAHAAALDAVQMELDMERDLGQELITRYGLFEVQTAARSKDEYLRNPDLGRHFDENVRKLIQQRCSTGADLQIAIGDGLSVSAVAAQVSALLPLVVSQGQQRRWNIGRPFAIRYCRVGILNEIGELLQPRVALLLIGERPGLATAESLSAYMAFQPRPGHTDADRNLISNIHSRGVTPEDAASRIVNFAAQLMACGKSGASVKEVFTAEARRRGEMQNGEI